MEAVWENLQSLRKKCGGWEALKLEDVEVCCPAGISPFHVMTAMNMHDELLAILEKEDNVLKRRDINEKSKMDGNTALHIAIRGDNTEIVDVLVEYGADLTVQNDHGQTPFMLAVAKGKVKFVKELWKYRDKMDVNATDKLGNSALHVAAEKKWSTCVEKLLSVGAKMDLVNHEGKTPLTTAAANGHLESVKILVAKAEIMKRNSKFFTLDELGAPLSQALSNKRGEVTVYLMSKLDTMGVDAMISTTKESLAKHFYKSDNAAFELDMFARVFIACVPIESARKTMATRQMITFWMPVLKSFGLTEVDSCELAFSCICQLMFEFDRPELLTKEFVQQFINCGGPDITTGLLQAYMEYKKGSAIITAFSTLLPLCKVPEGQTWLRKNYHKIVESYQFYEASSHFLQFPDAATQKVKTMWLAFKRTFDDIQATESKKHEAELLAEEEVEKTKRNKRRKKRGTNKGQNEAVRCILFSPNAVGMGNNNENKDAVNKEQKADVNDTVETDVARNNVDGNGKVLNENQDDTSFNFRPNGCKAPLSNQENMTNITEKVIEKMKVEEPRNKEQNIDSEDKGVEFFSLRPNGYGTLGSPHKTSKVNTKSPFKTKSPGKNRNQQESGMLSVRELTKMILQNEEENQRTHKVTKQEKANRAELFKFTDKNNIKKYLSPKRHTKATEKITPNPEETDKSAADVEAKDSSGKKKKEKKGKTCKRSLKFKESNTKQSTAENQYMVFGGGVEQSDHTNKATIEKQKISEDGLDEVQTHATDTEEECNIVETSAKKLDYQSMGEVVEEDRNDSLSNQNTSEDRETKVYKVFRPTSQKFMEFISARNSVKNNNHNSNGENSEPEPPTENVNDSEHGDEKNGQACGVLDLIAQESRSSNMNQDIKLSVEERTRAEIMDEETSDDEAVEIIEISAEASSMAEKMDEETSDDETAEVVKNSDSSFYSMNLKSIWDISPTTTPTKTTPTFVIPIGKLSPASKLNKRRSRATFIVPDKSSTDTTGMNTENTFFVTRMNADNSIDVTRMNAENTLRSNEENHKSNNNVIDIFQLQKQDEREKNEDVNTEVNEDVDKDLAISAIGRNMYDFLSESRLKSSGSIKSDTSDQRLSAREIWKGPACLSEVQFGYFSSNSSTTISTKTSISQDEQKSSTNGSECQEKIVDLSRTENFLSKLETSVPPQRHKSETSLRPHVHLEKKSKSVTSLYKSPESRKRLNVLQTGSSNSGDRVLQNRFGAIGEPCPPMGFDYGKAHVQPFADLQTEGHGDHSRLKPGDGDRLLDDDEPREVFCSRSYWKEPSYFGYGWLDGLSQAMAAQHDLVNTNDVDAVLHKYPVLNQGGDYENFKRRRLEEQWQNRPKFMGYDSWSSGEPVQVDQQEAAFLLPHNLLDSPRDSTCTASTQELRAKIETAVCPQKNNQQQQQHEPQQQNLQYQTEPPKSGPFKLFNQYELFPMQQVTGFQTGDMCFPQPGVPVVGNQQSVVPQQHISHGKALTPFNCESQTGQGDPLVYNNLYLKVPGGNKYLNSRTKPEMTKARSVPFLSSASAMIEAEKTDPLHATEYSSEPSDKSSLTSTTINTINSFKSANELVCSRSDIYVSNERLGESFVIGKGKYGSTIYESWTGDGRLVAIRRMKIEDFNGRERQIAAFIRARISHKNICDFLEVKRGDQHGFIVMERFKENLKHFITRTRAQGNHPLQYLISMCRGLVHGLAFLHDRNIYHGRLCPENVLLGPNDLVKLSDYGLPFVNSPVYQRTEFLDEPKSIWLCTEGLSKGDSLKVRERIFKADVQLCGMLIYYTLTLGDHPFGRCPEEVLENLGHGPACMRQLGEEFDDILPKMLHVTPDQRPTMEAVKLHPFLWTDSEKFRFLVNVGHHLYRSRESKNEVSATLERCINDLSPTSGKQSWVSSTQMSLVQEITGLLSWIAFRYNVGGLLSFMEAVDTYQHLLSLSSQKLLAGHPEVYFLTRFPALPIRVHQLVRVLDRQLPVVLYPTIDC